MISFSYSKAQLLYQESHLFIGQKPTYYNASDLGTYPGIYIGPNFGVEFFENGLNFWRPFGSTNWGNYKIFIDQSGKIGVGRKLTTYALEVNGQVWTTSGLLITSDKTLKRNITDIGNKRSDYLSKLMNLNGKSYEKQLVSSAGNAEEVAKMVAAGKIKKKDAQLALESMNKTNEDVYKKEFGFIAQEVKEIFPELVEESADGVYALNYTGLIPILLEAIKELNVKVTALEKQSALIPDISIRSGEATTSTNNENIVSVTEYLSQNIPNPVNGSAKINYHLPEGATSAFIAFYSANGTMEKSISLNTSQNNGSIIISSAELSSGIHIYKLVVNGIIIDSKKMVNK